MAARIRPWSASSPERCHGWFRFVLSGLLSPRFGQSLVSNVVERGDLIGDFGVTQSNLQTSSWACAAATIIKRPMVTIVKRWLFTLLSFLQTVFAPIDQAGFITCP